MLARISAAALLCMCAAAQAPPAFEVATIKPRDLDHPGPPFRIGPDVLNTSGALKHLILFAYDLQSYQLTGGEPWTQSEFYELQGKAGQASTQREIKAMLQTLLAERFQLKLGRETKTKSGYALIIDKNGPKLPSPRTDMPPESQGVIQMGGGEMWSRGSTLHNLAHALYLELGVPVVDETKIEGHYDFKLRFEEGNRELVEPDTDAAAAGHAGSVFTALREVGLKLESRKLPVEVMVIESAQRPSGN